MAKRPLLITIVAALYALAGIIGLIGGIAGFFVPEVGTASAAGSTIVGIISLIVAFGMFKGISIFWYIGVIFSVIFLILSIVAIVLEVMDGNAAESIVNVIQAAIYVIVLWYLFRTNVKEFFTVGS